MTHDCYEKEFYLEYQPQLDIKTVAEGVESQDQVQILKDKECDIIQGYYYSKPLREEEALKFFGENS